MESTLGIHHHRHSIRLKGYDYSQPGAYFVTLVTHQREDSFGSICMDRVELTALGRIVQEEWRRSAEIRKEIRLWDDEFVVMPNHVHGIVWIVGGGVGADGIRPGSPGKIPGVEDTGRGDGENRGDGEIGGACITRGAYHAPLRDDGPVGVGVDGIRPGLTGITHDMEDTGGGNGETRDECITRGAWHVPLRDDGPVGVGADGIRPGSPGMILNMEDTGGGAGPAPLRINGRMPRSLSAMIAGFKSAVTSRAWRELGQGKIWQRNYYEHIIRDDSELETIRLYITNNPRCWGEDQLKTEKPSFAGMPANEGKK